MSKRIIHAIIIVLALGVLMLIIVCGASTGNVQNDDLGGSILENDDLSGFIIVKTNTIYEAYPEINVYTGYDPDTMVMYALFADCNGLTITRLDNADGTPKLYSPNTEVD